LGSSRSQGEVRVDSQEKGRLAVAKHTNPHSLLSPCILLILLLSVRISVNVTERFANT